MGSLDLGSRKSELRSRTWEVGSLDLGSVESTIIPFS